MKTNLLGSLILVLGLNACTTDDVEQVTETDSAIAVSETDLDTAASDTDTGDTADTGSTYDPDPSFCNAPTGEWTSCPIDRSAATGYIVPTLNRSIPFAEYGLNAAPIDADNDGDYDLVFADEFVGSGVGFLCNENGALGACSSDLHLPVIEGSTGPLLAEDANGDGDVDLFVTSYILPLGMDFEDLLMELFSNPEVNPFEADVDMGFEIRAFTRHAGTWVEKTSDWGFDEPFMLGFVQVSNISLQDTNMDGQPELIVGRLPGAPMVWEWDGGTWVKDMSLLPMGSNVSSQTGVFMSPVSAVTSDRELYIVNYGGRDYGMNDGGSTCWYGSPDHWEERPCPSTFSGSPMGMSLGDFNRDGRLDHITTDIGTVHVCISAGPFAGLDCADDSANLRTAVKPQEATLWGEPYHPIFWGTLIHRDLLFFVNGFEHTVEHESYGPLLAGKWFDELSPMQLLVVRVNADGSYTRVQNAAFDEGVHERGIIGPLQFNPSDRCPSIMPLPVGLTPLRVLADGTCPEGTQVVQFRYGNAPAYGSGVMMLGPDGQRHLAIVNGTSYRGFTPPVLEIGPEVTSLEVTWTTGEVTTVNRLKNGRFPDVIRP